MFGSKFASKMRVEQYLKQNMKLYPDFIDLGKSYVKDADKKGHGMS